MSTILLVIVILLLIGAFPRWNHSRNWGYGPSGLLTVLLVVLLVMALTRAPNDAVGLRDSPNNAPLTTP